MNLPSVEKTPNTFIGSPENNGGREVYVVLTSIGLSSTLKSHFNDKSLNGGRRAACIAAVIAGRRFPLETKYNKKFKINR